MKKIIRKTNNFSKEESKAFTKVRQKLAKENHRKMSEMKFYDYAIEVGENVWYEMTYEKIFCGEVIKDRVAAKLNENGKVIETLYGLDC